MGDHQRIPAVVYFLFLNIWVKDMKKATTGSFTKHILQVNESMVKQKPIHVIYQVHSPDN